MGHTLIDPSSTTYVVAYTENSDTEEKSVCHYTVVEPGDHYETGLQTKDEFDTEQAAYEAHGEHLPARYRVLKKQTQEEIIDQETDDVIQEAQFEWSIEPIDDTTTTTGIDTEIVDEVALKQTAYDKYDEVNA